MNNSQKFCSIIFILGWLYFIVASLAVSILNELIIFEPKRLWLLYGLAVVLPWFFLVVGSAKVYISLEDENYDRI